MGQDNARALQKDTPDAAVQQSTQVHYPNWPTSKPGPMATQPPAGMRPVNPLRSEQMLEVGYNQETGEPGLVQLETAPMPEGPLRRTERL